MKKMCVVLSIVTLVAAVLVGVVLVRNHALQADLTAEQDCVSAMTTEIAALKDELAAAKAEIESKTAEFAAKEEALANEAAANDAAAKEQIAQLNEQLTAAQSENEADKAAQATLGEELAALKAEKETMSAEIEKLNGEIAAKAEEIINVTALKDAAEKKLEELKTNLQPMIEAVENIKQSVADNALLQGVIKPFTDGIEAIKEVFGLGESVVAE